ncbi:MAG: hypothetical protein Q9166_004692 [cf. Caloplaca sp. 2 TL-2023]
MPTLERYLSTIFDSKYIEDKPPGNRKFRFKQNPELDRTRTNVILIYRGAHNPPHRGHLAVLWHAYHQLAHTLNVVAAFIRPRDDASVRDKYGSNDSKHIVSLADRVRLWTEDANFPPWAWVYTNPLGCSGLKEELRKLAKKDKCRIRFADVYGPDNVNPSSEEDSFNPMTVVTDVAREAEYDHPQNGLPLFRNTDFGHWVMDDGNETTPAQTKEAMLKEHDEIQRRRDIAAGEALAKQAVQEKFNSVLNMSANLFHDASDLAQAKVNGLLGLPIPQPSNKHPDPPGDQKIVAANDDDLLTSQIANLSTSSSVSVCWQKYRTPWKSLRFLRSTPTQHAPFRGISSTAIQKMIHELNGHELKTGLESMALSPCLLWELLPGKLKRDKDADKKQRECRTSMWLRAQGLIAREDMEVPMENSVDVDGGCAPESPRAEKRKWDCVDMSAGGVVLQRLRKRQRICYVCAGQRLRLVCKHCRVWKLEKVDG